MAALVRGEGGGRIRSVAERLGQGGRAGDGQAGAVDASKEELLFPESDARVQAAIDAIATRTPEEGSADVLLRALGTATETSDELVSPLARLRLRLIHTVPAGRGRALQVQVGAAPEIRSSWPRPSPTGSPGSAPLTDAGPMTRTRGFVP